MQAARRLRYRQLSVPSSNSQGISAAGARNARPLPDGTLMAATKSIELKTGIPGPRSQEILLRKERVVANPLSIFLPVVIERGEGATLTDVDGNMFIDFTGGVGCLNVGHTNPRVVEAVHEQAAKFLHTDFTIVPYEVYITLAERLTASAPISGDVKAAFFNAGTEAIENAIKFSRAYT